MHLPGVRGFSSAFVPHTPSVPHSSTVSSALPFKRQTFTCSSSSTPPTRGYSSKARGLRFELTKTVLPQDTDYSSALWHGAYVRWLEEARVRHLDEVGVDYAKLVSEEGLELLVTSLNLRYIRAARMGEVITLHQNFDLPASSRARLIVESQFVRQKADSAEGETEEVATAQVTITPVNVETGRIARRWPKAFADTMRGLFEEGETGSPAEEIPSWLAA